MYRFIRCQTHPKCPNVIGWYLVVRAGDVNTVMDLHRAIGAYLLYKFNRDPHYAKSPEALICSPLRLAAGWLEAVMQHNESRMVLVNSRGGWMTFDGVKVLGEITNDGMIWPTQYDDETITIGKYPNGRHYYLSSNRGRIFVPPSYPTYDAAEAVAKQYTNSIKTRNYLGDSA
jgi:hypothetical protein